LDDLFTQLSKILKEERLEKKVEENISEEFKNYFLNEANRSNFIKNIDSQQEGNKLLIRDYYLYLLHTSNVMKEDSILVSTSTAIKTARTFASPALRNDDIAIIFHYFICEPYIYHTFTPWKMEEFEKFEKAIKEVLNFPIYNTKGLFPKQNEVAIKGGLLPHNILGIELVKEKKIIVNPHLFEDYNIALKKLKNIQWFEVDKHINLMDFNYYKIESWHQSNDIETIFKYGRIFIDQSEFDEVIKLTEYSHKIIIDSDGFSSKKVE